MATRLGKFELPNRLIKEEETANDKYAKFIADPFESGYGHTIGNAFRRVLLSSIEGAAISSLKIDGVQHEFQSVDGIVEDITDIVLNLKKILIVSHKAEPVTITLEVEKEGEITAADISPAEGIEIINPEQLILTTDRKQKVVAEMTVSVGRGFCLGEDSKTDDQPIGVINVDASTVQ
jgi:DNA-directed RNA polymerase subunit alpha